MPTENFGRLSGHSPNEVNYLRYGDRQERPAIYTAIATRFGNFAVGLGTYYTLKASGSLQMSLNNQSSAARLDLSLVPVLQLHTVESPIASLQTQGSLTSVYLTVQLRKPNLRLTPYP